MCTLLLGIAERGHITPSNAQSSLSSIIHESPNRAKTGSFYGSNSITNGTYLIACILMHMDTMLSSHPMFKKIKSSDSTFLDVKD